MGFISEFLYPTRWYSKIFVALLALTIFLFLAVAALSGFLLYRVVSPAPSRSELDFSDFPGHPEDVTYQVPGEGSRDGWFFPGLRQAPTILLCPGYQTGRGQLLTLATALQDQQFNVFLFDFSAGSTSTKTSTLGYREVLELRAALDAVAQRNDVDPNRFGLWGTDVGAYAAMGEAEGDRRVAAIAVESVYDTPKQELDLLTTHSGLAAVPFVLRGAEIGFGWMTRPYRDTPPLSTRLSRLSGEPKLFIEAQDAPALADATRQMFLLSPEPRDEESLPRGNYAAMMDEEMRGYENRIVSFFLLNLTSERAFRARAAPLVGGCFRSDARKTRIRGCMAVRKSAGDFAAAAGSRGGTGSRTDFISVAAAAAARGDREFAFGVSGVERRAAPRSDPWDGAKSWMACGRVRSFSRA